MAETADRRLRVTTPMFRTSIGRQPVIRFRHDRDSRAGPLSFAPLWRSASLHRRAFRPGVYAAQREAMAEPTSHVHFQGVIVAHAFGKPGPCIRDGRVRFRRDRIEESSSRHGCAGQRTPCGGIWEGRRAWARRANNRDGRVRVNADQFVISRGFPRSPRSAMC